MAAWFAKVPIEARSDDRLSAADLRVLICIAEHDGKRGCFASHGTIAEETRLLRQTVVESISKLGDLAYITSTVDPRDGRRRILRVNYQSKSVAVCRQNTDADLSSKTADLSPVEAISVGSQTSHVDENKAQSTPNRPEQTIKNRGEENRPSNNDVRKVLEQTIVHHGGSLKRATRIGPDTSDPAVRKQIWESKCAAKLTETVDNADDIIDAYQRGEQWAVKQFNDVSELHGLRRRPGP
jgi:DNA-binding MarR family transcriptional regulator